MFPDVPAGGRIPPRVHAGPVGAGEAARVAHTPWSRRRCSGLQSRCGGTDVPSETKRGVGWVEFNMFIFLRRESQSVL